MVTGDSTHVVHTGPVGAAAALDDGVGLVFTIRRSDPGTLEQRYPAMPVGAESIGDTVRIVAWCTETVNLTGMTGLGAVDRRAVVAAHRFTEVLESVDGTTLLVDGTLGRGDGIVVEVWCAPVADNRLERAVGTGNRPWSCDVDFACVVVVTVITEAGARIEERGSCRC